MFINYNSRLVVDEYDNGKLRLERVKHELLRQITDSDDEKYLYLSKYLPKYIV